MPAAHSLWLGTPQVVLAALLNPEDDGRRLDVDTHLVVVVSPLDRDAVNAATDDRAQDLTSERDRRVAVLHLRCISHAIHLLPSVLSLKEVIAMSKRRR